MIRPNRSMSWRSMQRVYLLMVAAGLAISAGLALAGAWPVVPFAGLELLVTGACLYRCAQRCAEREVIRIDGGRVAVERGRYSPVQRFELPRPWARVGVLRSPARGHPSRVLIQAHGRAVEVGARLTERERRLLARRLRHYLGDEIGPMEPA